MNENILYAWIYPLGEQQPVLCGALELLNGRRCVFSYDAQWLGHEKRFALSPDLALRAGVMEPPAGLELHPIFEDAGPDRWGKNVINKVFNPQRRSPLEYLERAGEDRIGALGFSRSALAYEVLKEQAFHVADLGDLMHAAQALSTQAPIDENLRRLLRPGASAGGARPKAIIQHEGGDWIAKFPTLDDEHDICAMEHASLLLAKSCGIDVPESQLVDVGGRNVLLVKRFDRAEGGRLHYASARSMALAEGIREDDMGYADLADLVRRSLPDAKKQCHELFRRMALNVLLENTDDHGKNHAFLLHADGWRLSPAYDIQPQLQGIGYQQLRIGHQNYEPSMANVLSDCGRFMLKKDEAVAVLSDVADKVCKWPEVFARAGVPQRDVDACARYVMNEKMFRFGQAPKSFVLPEEKKSYSGKPVAVVAEHLYQHVGRDVNVQHQRSALPSVTLPEQNLHIRYEAEKAIISKDKEIQRGGR